MLDIALVQNTIQELENSDTTFNNCEKLASLYIVRHFNSTGLNPVVQTNKDVVEKELADIFPYYKKYCDVKRDYQLNKVGEEVVLTYLASVCKEILEFIHILYNSTDTPQERNIIVGNLSNIEF